MSDLPATGAHPAFRSLYDGFISYSHAKDKPVAAALQTVMQRLGKPWHRRRMLRIFRDDTSLAATPELWPTLEKTLDQSRYVIILASPQFARSKWCGMEVAHWLERKSLDTLLIALTEGDLLWDEAAGDFVWDGTTPLPAILKGHFRTEPKWIDLRPWRDAPDARDPKFIDAAADLAAAVHGLPKEDLLSQEVRQQKRALRLAWSAAASLTLLAGGASWQWWEAVQAKQAAERNLLAAQTAADDLVFKIADGLRGVEGMRVEAVRRILDTARTVIDDLAKTAPLDLRLQNSRANMLHEFALTLLSAGDAAGARENAERSLALGRQLAVVYPDHRPLQQNIGNTLGTIGGIRKAQGDDAGALEAYEEALAVTRKARELDPAHMPLLYNEASLLSSIGELKLAAGLQREALNAFERSLALGRQLTETLPQDGGTWRSLAISLSNIASIRLAMSDREGAFAAYGESIEIFRKLAEVNIGNAGLQHDIGLLLIKVGDARQNANDLPSAFLAYDEALSIGRRSVAADENDVGRRRNLSVALQRVGDARLAGGNIAGAVAAYEEGLATSRHLVKAAPWTPRAKFDLANSLQKVGDVRLRAGEIDAALEAQSESIAILDVLVAADPENTAYSSDLGLAHYKLGETYRAAGRKEQARAAYDKSLGIIRTFANKHPAAPLQHQAAERMIAVALLREADDRSGAAALYAESAMLLREMVSDYPDNLAYKIDLVMSLERAAWLTTAEQAGPLFAEALAILEPLRRAGKLTADQQKWPEGIRAALARLTVEGNAVAVPTASAAPTP